MTRHIKMILTNVACFILVLLSIALCGLVEHNPHAHVDLEQAAAVYLNK